MLISSIIVVVRACVEKPICPTFPSFTRSCSQSAHRIALSASSSVLTPEGCERRVSVDDKGSDGCLRGALLRFG